SHHASMRGSSWDRFPFMGKSVLGRLTGNFFLSCFWPVVAGVVSLMPAQVARSEGCGKAGAPGWGSGLQAPLLGARGPARRRHGPALPLETAEELHHPRSGLFRLLEEREVTRPGHGDPPRATDRPLALAGQQTAREKGVLEFIQ